MKSKKLELSELVQKFEVHKRSEGYSERTVEWYQQSLSLFQAWLEQEGMSTCLDDLGEDEMRLFILHLKARPGLKGPASSHTVNNRVRALRAFFNWLYEEGYTECHRLEKIKLPKTRKKLIKILTDEEIGKIYQAMDPHTPSGARDTAIISLILDTGLRLSEVVHLKYRDVHLEDGYLKVLGKGDKERFVAFGGSCQRSLIEYAYHFREEPDDVDAGNFSVRGRVSDDAGWAGVPDREALQVGGNPQASPPTSSGTPTPPDSCSSRTLATPPWR